MTGSWRITCSTPPSTKASCLYPLTPNSWPDPALDRLLGLCTSLGSIPLALAVIPKTVHQEAAGAILAQDTATVIQHGYAHQNHAVEGERKAELADNRDGHDALDELVIGRRRLEAMFDDCFAPILAPPWNRLAEPLLAQLAGAGLSGLSTYGPRTHANPAEGLAQVDRKSTRLNSSHKPISYAAFCLKKQNK